MCVFQEIAYNGISTVDSIGLMGFHQTIDLVRFIDNHVENEAKKNVADQCVRRKLKNTNKMQPHVAASPVLVECPEAVLHLSLRPLQRTSYLSTLPKEH